MRKFVRLSLAAGAAAAVVGGAFVAAPSMADPGGGACTLHGTANFTPGVGATGSTAFTYNFSGALANCGSSAKQGPDVGGTISAGDTFTLPDGAGGTVTYNPIDTPSGTGDCSNGTTQGTSVVQWDDGTVTFIKYSTQAAAAGVVLTGNILDTVTATTTGGQTVTLSSTKYTSADGAAGLLAFEADATQCNTATGVTSAGIDGVTGIGHQQ